MKFDKQRKKTYTNYWNNFSTKPKKVFFIINFLRKLKLYIFKVLGFNISIRIKKNIILKDEAHVSYPVNDIIKKYKNTLISKELESFIKQTDLKFNKQKIERYLNEFDEIFYKSPVKDHNSGFGYNEGLFFFTLLKIIKPELVIESGVMKGFTTYLIDYATDDDCEIFSYDINFDNKIYNSKKAIYINKDITTKIPDCNNKKIVALWDDHTSQLDRLIFSQKHNIKYNFFDDDLSFLNIHSDGWPPIPTISMLKDIRNIKINLEQIRWISRNREGLLYPNNLKDINCIDRVEFHKVFPQLFPITGYKNHSQCSFVINKLNV